MPKNPHIVIIAGEASGDLHAAAFVRPLKTKYPHVQFSGIGGAHMLDAGVHLISDIARFGITGLAGVLRHAAILRRTFKDIKAHLRAMKPDLLILVDYPGFNLRLAKFAKQQLGIRILYYVSPQIWAWKAGRINTIRAYIDHMAVILPFEKKIYDEAGVPATFVGHPLLHHMENARESSLTREQLGIATHLRLIALLPGSRLAEVASHMPVLVKSAQLLCQQSPHLHFVIPVANTIDPECIRTYFKNTTIPFTLTQEKVATTVACSDMAIVASGTASLECALIGKPMCIIYKVGLLTHVIATQVMKVKYLGLCNVLQNKMIVPEFLQYDCNPTELTRTMMQFLNDESFVKGVQANLQHLKNTLSSEQAETTISALIEREITKFYPLNETN